MGSFGKGLVKAKVVHLPCVQSRGPDVMAPPRAPIVLGISVPSSLGYDGEAMSPEIVSRPSFSLTSLTVRKGRQKLSAP